MFRKRSRAVGCKQGAMSDSQSSTPNDTKQNKPSAAFLFPSPRVISGLSPKSLSDHEARMSPTSTLENKHLSNLIAMPCFSDVHPKKTPLASSIIGTAATARTKHSKPVSLGILDVLDDDDSTEKLSSQQSSRKVLFASQLKIKVPLISPKFNASVAPLEFPSSPIEFGIKNKDSQLALFSPAQRTLSAELPAFSPRVVPASIPVREMELSEDYTRVISHGPNPRTTHIFDDCIVDASEMDDNFEANCNCFQLNNSLSCCDAFKKDFDETKDIKTYSSGKEVDSEFHYQEILLSEH